MKFREETIQDFNSYRDTTLTEAMTFSEAVENIENANNSYFYIINFIKKLPKTIKIINSI